MDNEVSEIKTIRWEKWTALGTIVMALCALLSSLWQGYSLQQHNKLSLRPYLQLEVNADRLYDSDLYVVSIYVNNNGLGPADVTSATFVLDDQILANTAAIWTAMGLDSDLNCQFGFGNLQRFYKVGDRQLVLSATSEGCQLTKTQLEFLRRKLKIKLSYRSLYGEEFIALWEKM